MALVLLAPSPSNSFHRQAMHLRPDRLTKYMKMPCSGRDPRWLMLLTVMSCTQHLTMPQPAERVAPPHLAPPQRVSVAPPKEQPPAAVKESAQPMPPAAVKESAQPMPAVAVKESAQPIPLHVMAGAIEPIHGDDPTLPADLMASARGKILEGAYKMCISADGSVKSVTPVVSIAGADRSIVAALSTWKFPLLPIMICKVQTLSFEVP